MALQHQKIYRTFESYPFDTDRVFVAGLSNILKNMSVGEEDEDEKLLKAKHFYFCRFQQNFNLDDYLEYKKTINTPEAQEELFERIENYDYDNDKDYAKGLPNIIQGWLEQQSKSGLWDKEKLDMEFVKAKAFYYCARIEKFDLIEYLTWKAKKEDSKKSVCPFANLWQNKNKVGPVDQVNGLTFVVTEKPVGQGAETVTISSPKSKNVYTVDRLNELMESLKDGHEDETVTSIFITATVADSSNPFEASERIETKDTKVVSKGLAYDETLALSEDPNIRQVSLQSLAETYHKVVSYTLNEKAKPAVTFTNGQVTLSSIYLALSLGFLRVITENALIEFKLELSHSPIPPLLLLAMCRARKGTEKSKLPDGFELYMALACPEYSKVRAPEILAMGLADVFIPEGKLSDAFDTAKKMAVCPAPDTTSAVQLALAIYHSYAGPNRLQVWEKEIESVFGGVESFEILQSRLKETNNTWSNNILKHWETLPPTLLKVIFKAVTELKDKSPLEILDLEKQLNAKWRQTDDYQKWLESGTEWVTSDSVDFYFDKLEMPDTDDVVVYEAPQETQDETPMVCPVTGQSSGAVCPVTGQSSAASASCPVTGQSSTGDDSAAVCPATGKTASTAVCPVSGKSDASTDESSGCPFSKGQTIADDKAVCPVTGQSASTNNA